MQIFTIIAVCMIILTVFGIFNSLLQKAGLTRFEFVFVYLAYILLSAFDVSLNPEIRVNAAVLFLPFYFLFLHFSKFNIKPNTGVGFLIMASFLFAQIQRNYSEYLGIVLSALCILSVFLFKRTPVFAVFIVSCIPVVSVIFAASFDYMENSYAACELVGNNILNMQLAAAVLSTLLINFTAEKRSVIKA